MRGFLVIFGLCAQYAKKDLAGMNGQVEKKKKQDI
jgi:hypothetical protein